MGKGEDKKDPNGSQVNLVDNEEGQKKDKKKDKKDKKKDKDKDKDKKKGSSIRRSTKSSSHEFQTMNKEQKPLTTDEKVSGHRHDILELLMRLYQ